MPTFKEKVLKKKVLILGGGPAGLTCAYKLAQSSSELDILVVEKEADVGGMCRSIHLDGWIVDQGPHRLFSKNTQVVELWREILEDDSVKVQRLTRIFFRGEFIDYPLKMLNVLKVLGLRDALFCLLSYVKTFFKKEDDTSFEGHISNSFGKYLFHLFFKDYSEKLWGMSCDKIDSKFAKQRVKGIGIKEILFNLFKKNKLRTFVDQFDYPKKGNGYLYQKMFSRCKELDVRFSLLTSIESLGESDDRYQAVLSNGQQEEFDFIVSTIPIDLSYRLFFKDLPHESFERLKFRSTLLVYVEIQRPSLFPDQWLYIQDKQVEFGRLTNFSNWSADMVKSAELTCLCAEFWCNEQGDEMWQLCDQQLFHKVVSGLHRLGLVENGVAIHLLKVLRLAKTYPVYYKGYEQDLSLVQQKFQKLKNVHLIGRAGSYKYNNQDHSNLMGLQAAKKILGDHQIDLWQINSDDDYQES